MSAWKEEVSLLLLSTSFIFSRNPCNVRNISKFKYLLLNLCTVMIFICEELTKKKYTRRKKNVKKKKKKSNRKIESTSSLIVFAH